MPADPPANPPLPPGYSPVPEGHVATVVTYLEMTAPPPARAPRPGGRPLVLERLGAGEVDAYRALFRAVGEPWLWFSRLAMPEDELGALLADPDVETHALVSGRSRLGLLELDFREPGACEIALFGLVPDAVGEGLGRAMMAQAISRAWARPIGRLWLHTCTFDHPKALGFYRHMGFRPVRFAVEVAPDPRRLGQMPSRAAPHVPLIGG